jgi:hypothetical protein
MDDQMNPEASRLIAQVRLARTPGIDDKERVRRALAMALAAGALSVPAITAGAAAAKTAAGVGVGSGIAAAGAAGLTAGAKVLVSVALVASLGGGAYFWAKRPAAPARPVALTAPMAAPLRAEPPIPAEAPAPAELPAPEALAPAATNTRDPLLAELTLLHKAQQAWRTGGARGAAHALELAQLHARRYPHSTLRLERDALRLFALCSLGRRAQARPLAAELLKRAPDSPLRTSVEESCGRR